MVMYHQINMKDYMQSNFVTNNQKILRKLLPIGLLFGLVILCFVGFTIFQSTQFHLINTTPNLNSVGVVTPYISLNYNALLVSGAVVTSQPNVVDSYEVSGKSLVIHLKSSVITLGKNYNLSVSSISNKSGKSLSKRSFSFTVRNIAFDSLSAAQKSAVLKQQSTVPYSRNSINYIGIDALVSSGLSAAQVQDLEQAFFLYAKSVNQEITQFNIEANSLVLAPYDSTSATQSSSLTFNVTVSGKTLAARLNYTGLSAAELFLYDSSNNSLIYDSGVLTPSAN